MPMAWIETGQFFKDKAMDLKTAPDVEKQQGEKSLNWHEMWPSIFYLLCKRRTKEIGLGYVLQMVGFTKCIESDFSLLIQTYADSTVWTSLSCISQNRLIAYTSQPSNSRMFLPAWQPTCDSFSSLAPCKSRVKASRYADSSLMNDKSSRAETEAIAAESKSD